MKQKTYWWRTLVASTFLITLFLLYAFPCNLRISRCLGGDSILISRTIFHFSLSLLTVSPFLFFVRDGVFLRWMHFAIGWFAIAIIFIVLAPVSARGWMNFGPTKELVSMWMGGLFIPTSLIKLARDSQILSDSKKAS